MIGEELDPNHTLLTDTQRRALEMDDLDLFLALEEHEGKEET